MHPAEWLIWCCKCTYAMLVLKTVCYCMFCVYYLMQWCMLALYNIDNDTISSFSEETILFIVNTNASQSVQVQPYGMVTLTPVTVINSTSSSVPPSIEQILSLRVKATVEVDETVSNGTGTCGLIIINRQQEIVAAVDFRRLVRITLTTISTSMYVACAIRGFVRVRAQIRRQ